MFVRGKLAFLVLLAAAGLAGTARSAVIVVDDGGGPGVNFTDLAPAVAAAAANDMILVKGGVYSGFVVNNKALKIQSERMQPVTVVGTVVITNAPAAGVAISGLRIAANGGGVAVAVNNCAGPVFLERLQVFGQGTGLNVADALRVISSASVTITDSVIQVTAGGPDPGLRSSNSNTFLYESTIRGGRGFHAPVSGAGGPGGIGGSGVIAEGTGLLFASGCRLEGGSGGNGSTGTIFPICGSGGAGGPGVTLQNAADLKTLDCELAGGLGGQPGDASCGAGAVGAPLVDVSSAVPVDFGVPSRTYDIPSPVREGTSDGYITLSGEAGEFVWIFLSVGTMPSFSNDLKGVLLPAAPQIVIFLGALPVAGEITFQPLSLPVNPSMVSISIYEQAIYYTPAKGFTASNPRMGWVLDQQF